MFVQLASDCVLVGLIGGLLCLDRTGAFQVMISRPLVSAPLIGVVLGQSNLGLGAGVLIELLYMADRPVGGYMPTHETALAVLVTAVSAAFMAGSGVGGGAVTIRGFTGVFMIVVPVLLLSILVAPIYRMADVFSRRMNEKLYCEAIEGLNVGTGGSVMLIAKNLRGLFNFFWPVAAMLFISVFVLSLVAFSVGSKFGAAGVEVLSSTKLYPAIAGFLILGISFALNAIKGKGTLILFSATGVLTVLIWTALK